MTGHVSDRELVERAMCGVEIVTCPQCGGAGRVGPPTLPAPCPTCQGCGKTTTNEQEAQ
jgi:DnaJ-class molecular chaperone